MKHTCHVPKCEVIVLPKMLMCSNHWTMVPEKLQFNVYETFNKKQCTKEIRPTTEYLKAARAAINFIVNLESPTPEGEKEKEK